MWRKFNFFEKSTVNDERIVNFFKEVKVSCCASGRGDLIFGDNRGIIHILDKNLVDSPCSAFNKGVSHLKHCKPNYLIAVGDDGGEAYHEVVKIFNLDKYEPKTGEYLLVNEIKIFGKQTKNLVPSSVTAIDVNQEFTCLALGFGNGTIILYQGDLARNRSQARILPGLRDNVNITGLHFKRLSPSVYTSAPSTYCLFVVTSQSVFTYMLVPGRSISETPNVLDDSFGCDVGCSTLSGSPDNDLVIVTKTGVWFYKTEGKGACFAFEGKKVLVHWFKSYLVLVSCDFNRQNNLQQTITIYDLKNKYIAFKYSGEKMHVNYIFQEWGQIFILVTEQSESTQSLFILEEKDTPTKLEILLQKNLYQIAIGLVNSQQLDSSYVVEIHRKFGDHLYSKKEYEQAMSQYLKTIGKLEPSYVIRKFLDAQRIKNLTTYLEALHTNEHNIATADHTTLLLNCYTKLKNDKKEKLDMFIRTQNELRYDVETAIHVCRQAGYREHALLLAKKHKEHGWFIKIHIEDFQDEANCENYLRALRHIESLRFELAHTYLKEFGKILVSKLPQQTTNVLIRLCTDYFAVDYTELDRSIPSNIFKMREKLLSKNKNLIRNQNAQNEVNQQSNTNLDTTNHDNDDVMTSATRLTSLFSKRKNQTEAITHNSVNDPTLDLNNTIDDLSTLNTYKDPFKAIANAEDFIDAYSNQAYWLMIFLENVITRNPKSPPQSKIVYNTLIELYLQLNANPEEPSQPVNSTNQSQQQQQQPQDQNKEQWDAQYANMFNDSEEVHSTSPTVNQTPDYHIEPTNPTFQQSSYETKILDLVENIDSNYDTEHVLVLVQSMNFKQGILKMYERLGLHYDIVQYYMEQGDYENVISSCKKYGESDLNLWVQVLSYFANSEALEFQDEIQNVLLKIEKDNLLPPLLVVQILSKHPKTKLGNIKEYLHNKLSQDQLMIKEDVDKIKDYQNSTKKMKREVHALQTSAKIFQSTTCQRCNDQLDLPAVHFMCQHSFHARCLPDQDDCPTCAKHSRDILQHKKKFDENGPEQQEAFFKQLGKKNADGFSVVAEYFGRGIFNQASHGGGGGDLDHDDFE